MYILHHILYLYIVHMYILFIYCAYSFAYRCMRTYVCKYCVQIFRILLLYKLFVQNLEDKQKRHVQIKTDLEREQRQLRRRLEQLTKGSYRTRYERSVSECSTSALSTTSSFSSECGEFSAMFLFYVFFM